LLLMNQYGISQIPVVEGDKCVGSLSDNHLFAKLLDNSELKELPIKHVMEAPLPEVEGKASIEEVSQLFSNGATAVVVNYDGDKKHIITYQDVIRAIA